MLCSCGRNRLFCFACRVLPPLLMLLASCFHAQAQERSVIEKALQSVCRVTAYTKRGVFGGTGFFIDSIGTFVTNRHVIDEADSVSITVLGSELPVRSILADNPKYDLVLLRASPGKSSFTFLARAAARTSQADSVIVVGHPRGLQNTTTFARFVTSIHLPSYGDVMVLRGNLQKGSSGSPVLTASGEVIGVVAWGEADSAGMKHYAISVECLDSLETHSARPLASWLRSSARATRDDSCAAGNLMPVFTEFVLSIGDCYFNVGKAAQARGYYALATENQASCHECWNRLFTCLNQLQRYDEVITLSSRLRDTTSYCGAWAMVGNAHLARGESDRAIAVYTKAYALCPVWDEIGILLARLLLEKARADEALAVLDRIAGAKDTDWCTVWRCRAWAHALREEAARRLAALVKAADICGPDEELYIQIGDAYYSGKDYKKALESYGRALRVNTNSAEGWYGTAYCRIAEKSYAEALKAVQKLVTLWPDSARAHELLGDVCGKLELWPKAEAAYRRALTLRGDSASLYQGIGDAFWAREQYTEALTAYKSGHALNPGICAVAFRIGRLHDHFKQYPEAAEYFRKAIACDSTSAASHREYGIMCLKLTRLDEAMAALRTSLNLDTGDAASHAALSDVYRAKGDHTAAVASYEKALQLEPLDAARIVHMLDLYLTTQHRERYEALLPRLERVDKELYKRYRGQAR